MEKESGNNLNMNEFDRFVQDFIKNKKNPTDSQKILEIYEKAKKF